MKTIKMNLAHAKELSKADMKRIIAGSGAGSSCSMTYQDSSGHWHTESGTCKISTTSAGSYSNPWATTYTPYCNTSSFSSPTPLSSNGGTSACGAPFTH